MIIKIYKNFDYKIFLTLRYHLKASGGIYPVITIADVGFRGCNGTGFEAF